MFSIQFCKKTILAGCWTQVFHVFQKNCRYLNTSLKMQKIPKTKKNVAKKFALSEKRFDKFSGFPKP